MLLAKLAVARCDNRFEEFALRLEITLGRDRPGQVIDRAQCFDAVSPKRRRIPFTTPSCRARAVNRSEPAKKSGQKIPKNRFRTTVAELMGEMLAELPFIGDQIVCLSHDQGARSGPRGPSDPRTTPAGGY